MLIDWYTVGAQVLNFVILVWLMKHFLYQPILSAIGAREKLIADELADAASKKARAQKDRDEFQHKNEDFDRQRAALLGKATDEANAEGLRLLAEARKAADALGAQRKESLKNEAHNLNSAIACRIQLEVFAVARKVLADLAEASLEERMGAVFTRRLREMDGKAKETFSVALKAAREPPMVRSAFDLPADQRATIQNAINETFSADIHPRFETAPDLIGGTELTANGQKVAWSISDYLSSMEKGVGELLKGQDNPEPKVAPKPDAKPDAKDKPAASAKVPTAPVTKIETKTAPKTGVDDLPLAVPEAEAESKPELQAALILETATALEDSKAAPVGT